MSLADVLRRHRATRGRSVLGERPELPLSALLFIVVIGGWELICRLLEISIIVVPPPSAIAVALWSGLVSGSLIAHFGVTFVETMAGFAIGAAAGLALGALVGMFPLAEKTIYPYVVAFQTVPKVAIAPIIVIWFGYGIASKIVITATIAFFPVLANTIVGLRAAPRDQVELFIAFTGSTWQIFWKLRVRQALPYILVGLDVAIVLSVIGAIVGEFVGSQSGLGFLILQRNFNMDMAGVFAILVVLSVMGVGLHATVRAIQRRVVFWLEDDDDRIMGA
jgi:NitT/TauT family transport system permease protein